MNKSEHITANTQIISPTLGQVKGHKMQSGEICEILSELAREQDKQGRAHSIENCGTWLNFRQYHDKDSTRTLHTANFCKSPLCPMCAWRKALKLSHQLQRAILQNDAKYLYHLVLATDSTKEISKDRLKMFKQRATKFIKKYISGEYAISIEVTYNPEYGYHPHIHALICTDNFIKVSAEYIKYMAVLWASYNESAHAQNTFYITGITDKESASRELTKYILKYEGIDIKGDRDVIKSLAVSVSSMKKIQSAGQLKKDIAQVGKEYESERERKTKDLEGCGYELEIYNWLNGDYVRTN